MTLEDAIREDYDVLSAIEDRKEYLAERQRRTKMYGAAEWTLFLRTWIEREKEVFPIPELIGSDDIAEIVGKSIYSAVGVNRSHSSKLLARTIPGYGIFDDEKCRVSIEETDIGSRSTLSNAFFIGEHAEENARKLMQYALENKWKTKQNIPELIGSDDISKTLGSAVYSAVGLNRDNPSKLLAKTIPGFGILDQHKTEKLISTYHDAENGIKGNLKKIFFSGEHAQQNAEIYLEAYQRVHEKRRDELTKEDYDALPFDRALLAGGERQLPEKREGTYHQIQIDWNPFLEDKLRHLFAEYKEGLFNDRQLLWDALGVTSFAAEMKAAALGLIPEKMFGTGPAHRLMAYPFISYEGYSTEEEMRQTAETLEERMEINVEGFQTPNHAQGFHIQIPVVYKGIESTAYTKREQAVLNTIATYLHTPGKFARGVDKEDKPCFIAPETLEEPHCLVPVRIGSEEGTMLTKIYLPKEYCGDPGAIFSAVLVTPTKEAIFLFYHNTTGTVAA